MFVHSRQPCARPSVLSKVANIIGVFFEAHVPEKYEDFIVYEKRWVFHLFLFFILRHSATRSGCSIWHSGALGSAGLKTTYVIRNVGTGVKRGPRKSKIFGVNSDGPKRDKLLRSFKNDVILSGGKWL